MSAYFLISTGLRGCYMPDNAYSVRVKTRRELKQVLKDEASHQRGENVVGLSKRAIARHAAECWRRRNDRAWTMDLALPFGVRTDEGYGGGYPWAIFVSRETRADWVAATMNGE